MNIQKNRLAALIGLMLMVCMMVGMLAVPASAATLERGLCSVSYGFAARDITTFHDIVCDCDTFNADFDDVIDRPLFIDSNYMWFCDLGMLEFLEEYGCDCRWVSSEAAWDLDGEFFAYDTGCNIYEQIPDEFTEAEIFVTQESANASISDVVTPELFGSTLDEIVALLPIVIPVMIGFIGLRKGISFLQSVLHSA